jgi:AcrR family transcriptional regulator
VLERTLEDLAAHGISGLSIERIARAAEVNKTSVYRRWPTRGALVAAALERVASDLVRSSSDTGSLRSDLLAMANGIAALLSEPLGRELARAAFAADAEPELAALATRQLSGSTAAGEIVERARARGELRTDVDASLLLDLVAGSLLHHTMIMQRSPSKKWIESLITAIVHGVSPRRR